MKYRFDQSRKLIVVGAKVFRGRRFTLVDLAVDTGATRSVIDPAVLSEIGYSTSSSRRFVKLNTVGGQIKAPIITIDRLNTLGHDRTNIEVVAQLFSSSGNVRGLLGLDFFADSTLTIDFVSHLIEVKQP